MMKVRENKNESHHHSCLVVTQAVWAHSGHLGSHFLPLDPEAPRGVSVYFIAWYTQSQHCRACTQLVFGARLFYEQSWVPLLFMLGC